MRPLGPPPDSFAPLLRDPPRAVVMIVVVIHLVVVIAVIVIVVVVDHGHWCVLYYEVGYCF